MFKVGDRVTVVDTGKTYSTYHEWIDKNCPQFKPMWKRGGSPQEKQQYTIECIADHGKGESTTLLLISNGTQVYIIGEKGVELVKTKFSVGDRVTVVDQSTLLPNQRDNIGKTLEVTKVYPGKAQGEHYYECDGREPLYCESELIEAKEEQKMFKVGQKVKIIGAGAHGGKDFLSQYIGTTGEVADVHSGGALAVGCFGGTHDGQWVFAADELEKAPEGMTYEEALKAAIDGQKVTHDDYIKPWYIFYKDGRFQVQNCVTLDGIHNWDHHSFHKKSNWKLYEDPKAQPKFSVGQQVFYRGNRIAKVTAVSKETPFAYTLCADESFPKSTFVKPEEALKEVK